MRSSPGRDRLASTPGRETDERGVAQETDLGRVLLIGEAYALGPGVVQAVNEAGGQAMVLDLRQPVADVDRELVDLAGGRAAEAAVHALSACGGGIDAVVTAAGLIVRQHAP